jgi:hypothetical protein
MKLMCTKNIFRLLTQAILLLPIVLLLSGCPDDQTLVLVANLTKDRQTIEAHVKEIKKSFPATDPSYQEAKVRYLAAQSLYQGYITAVRLSIQTGIKGDLQSLATQSAAKSNEFLTYATDSLPQSRGLLSLLPPLNLAKIVSYFISLRDAHRTQVATMFFDAVEWKDWDAIS